MNPTLVVQVIWLWRCKTEQRPPGYHLEMSSVPWKSGAVNEVAKTFLILRLCVTFIFSRFSIHIQSYTILINPMQSIHNITSYTEKKLLFQLIFPMSLLRWAVNPNWQGIAGGPSEFSYGGMPGTCFSWIVLIVLCCSLWTHLHTRITRNSILMHRRDGPWAQ